MQVTKPGDECKVVRYKTPFFSLSVCVCGGVQY